MIKFIYHFKEGNYGRDKIFETIKCDDFWSFNLEYHNKRVANTIGLNIDLQNIYPILGEL